jgi:predicted subunit of tRNA(5-methylaminomethyl-2-thiouridylate) methyltransferase
MHYDSKHNTKKRTPDGDLFADGTRIQDAPSVQYPARRSLSDRAPFAYALSGFDVERMTASEYAWLAGE